MVRFNIKKIAKTPKFKSILLSHLIHLGYIALGIAAKRRNHFFQNYPPLNHCATFFISKDLKYGCLTKGVSHGNIKISNMRINEIIERANFYFCEYQRLKGQNFLLRVQVQHINLKVILR